MTIGVGSPAERSEWHFESFKGLALQSLHVAEPIATVIFVHGGLDRGRSFNRVARRLHHVDVVSYDRRGYQGSRGLAPLTLDEHINDLSLVVEHAREREVPVVIFGHSMGGIVALGSAFALPAEVAHVLVYETPLPWILRRTPARALSTDADLETQEFFERVVSPLAWERLGPSGQQERLLDGPALLADLQSLRHGAPFDLVALQVPATYLYGDHQNQEFYRELASLLRRRNPLFRSYQLTEAAHGAHLTQPTQLGELISVVVDDLVHSGGSR